MKNLTITDWSKQEYNVQVEKNKSIKIDCFFTNAHTPKQTSNEFKIGCFAEYGSYNLQYIGRIVAITEKTVSILHEYTKDEISRLKIADFCSRNWNFNLEKARKSNLAESYCI